MELRRVVGIHLGTATRRYLMAAFRVRLSQIFLEFMSTLAGQVAGARQAVSAERLVGPIVGAVIRYHRTIILLSLIFSVLAVDRVSRLDLNTDIAALMPDGVPSVENLRRVSSKTEGFSTVLVVIESPDPEASLNFVKLLREEVLTLPWVGSAEYAEDVSLFERYKLLYMESEDLRELQRRISDRIEYEKSHPRFHFDDVEVRVTLRNGRTSEEPPSVSVDDITEKYRKEGDERKTNGDQKLFQSDDGTIMVLVVAPRESTTDIGRSRRFMQDLEDKARTINPAAFHPRMTVDIGGRLKNRVMEFDAAISDVTGSAIWSISAILIILVAYFRRPTAILFIGVPLIMAIVWTFALTELIFGALNVVTVFLVLVLFGLGIDFGIHNLARYDESRRGGASMNSALNTIFRHTGRASQLAALTTVIGFFSLLITDFRAFYELGFITGAGIALAFVSMYSVFPSLLVLAEPMKLFRPSARTPDHDDGDAERAPYPWPKAGTVLTGIVFIACLAFATKVKFEEDFGKLNADPPEAARIAAKVKKVFTARSDRAVVFVPTRREVRALVKEVEARQAADVESPTISEVRSLYSIIPTEEQQRERLAIIREIRSELDDVTKYLNEEQKEELADVAPYLDIDILTPDELPPALRMQYLGRSDSGGYLVYIYNKASMSKMENAMAFADDIREIKIGDRTYFPATEALIFVDMRNLMQKESMLAVLVVALTASSLLALKYRSLTKAALILFPVTMGLVMMLGLMGLFGIRLSIFNMVVLPTMIGIGIDNGIHIFERYQEQGARGLMHVLRTTGQATAVTTLTTMLGFAGMLTASNRGLVSLGELAIIGLGACLIASVSAFPALLQLIEDRRRLESGQTGWRPVLAYDGPIIGGGRSIGRFLKSLADGTVSIWRVSGTPALLPVNAGLNGDLRRTPQDNDPSGNREPITDERSFAKSKTREPSLLDASAEDGPRSVYRKA